MKLFKINKKEHKSDYESGHASDFYESFSEEKNVKINEKNAEEVEKRFTQVIKKK